MAAFRRCLFAALPSIVLDACPTTVLEAMASGCPVISTATGGIVDMIADGENGLLIPPGDEGRLSAAMDRLLRDAYSAHPPCRCCAGTRPLVHGILGRRAPRGRLRAGRPVKSCDLPRPLRILMVCPSFLPETGGTQTHVYEVGRRLAALGGFAITVLATDRSRGLPREDCIDGIAVLRVPSWPRSRDYYLAPGIAAVIRQRRWDLVHCQGIHSPVPLLRHALRAAGEPAVPGHLSHRGFLVTVAERPARHSMAADGPAAQKRRGARRGQSL